MREMNEDASVYAGQRATAEAIERGGGGGLSVDALLAKVRKAAAPSPTGPDGGVAAAAVPDVDPDVKGPAAAVRDVEGPAAAVPDVAALAAAIAAVAGRHLPEGHLSPDVDFFDAGGTSVGAVELVAALEDELGMEIALDDVFADARPTSLAHRRLSTAGATAALSAPAESKTPTPGVMWAPDTAGTARSEGTSASVTVGSPPPSSAAGTRPAPGPGILPVPAPRTAPAVAVTSAPYPTARPEDLDQILADLALADRLPWTGDPEPLPPRRILLTGATGFLGSHMLLDLLRHSDAHVYCLVRAADEEAALGRIGEALTRYELPWSSEVRRRVTVLPGDIRRPHLGLSDELWTTLTHELDSVVGVAAAVDFLRGYQSLRQSNVVGSLTLAELAATGRPKPLHHISSIAVFNEVGITAMGEDDPLAHVDRLVAGYDQTKWAAEVALRRARDHGLIVTALRPGGIGGHTRTGAYNPQDLSSGLLSAFGRFRTVPAFSHLNAAPVDWVSRVAVGVVCEPDAWGYDYNLTGVPNTLDDVVRDMALGGMHVRVQDWDEWRTHALARLEAEPVPELAFLTRVLQSPTALRLCEATLKGPAATAERTAALVEALGLRPAARYDAQAQLRTFERLAQDGLARLPHKDDQPYLWFSETTEGGVGPVGARADTPCSMALTLSLASMYQLVKERRVDVTGELTCAAVHPEPLVVEHGDVWIRPEEGIPQRHGTRHRLLSYRLVLRDADGGRWWLEGHKYARARRDVWRQTRALTVEIGREGAPAALAGELVVPADSYLRDQVDGIKVDPRLTSQEKRAAKLTWLAWFGLEMGRGLLGPFARAAADLLDLRRTTTPSEHHR
ncbi:thioester reductase domain-containing protein [Streptomyces mirabilis]|uniref:thioester reductase domain-containing protein n=1 Tax=Streptomyces TaxID=1883 RepID=UPI001165C6EB|nr:MULTISPECIES: thioester reductase domain-containing protein [Streptomyces]MCX4615964.1 thioester reductase domain-containing protein [Streptomyces mirabilis]MCX5347260.1 thioester reductase domain-containing protein [Streptomyces mirabilis]QDN85973.1 NAD-dependent epimerase/dehydratase family protein [Streptomyces sp. RLB3-6]QDO06785.1 NAD-dependent epimerase/dehydratase family protein [Streptomyces sp. S1D4-23]